MRALIRLLVPRQQMPEEVSANIEHKREGSLCPDNADWAKGDVIAIGTAFCRSHASFGPSAVPSGLAGNNF